MQSISKKAGLLMPCLAGFVIMATELLATPLLAPAFGTSLPVWTVVIGVFLIALSIGYALGGRLADKADSVTPLAWMWVGSSVWLLLAPLLAQELFPEIGIKALALGNATLGTVVTTFVGMLLAFVVPMIMLSMTSPFIIGYWQRMRPDNPGKLTGQVYAVATIGSFLGVIAGPLVGMPLIGTRSTLFVLAGVLATVATWQLTKGKAGIRALALTGILIVEVTLLSWAAPVRSGSEVIAQEESFLQYIAVTQVDGEYRLEVNEGLGVQSAYRPSERFSNTYVDVFALLPYVEGSASESNVFLVGLAGGAIPRAMLQTTNASFEAVEFDPVIDRLAREHFALDDVQHINTTIGDGRVVLRQHLQQIQSGEREQYNYVFADAFQNETTVPPHLITQEWFQEVQQVLSDNGVFAMNLVTLDLHGPLAVRTMNTLASVFASVYLVDIPEYGNIFLVASNDPEYELRVADSALSEVPQQLRPLMLAIELSQRVAYQDDAPIFTDDRAPTGLLTTKMVWESIR